MHVISINKHAVNWQSVEKIWQYLTYPVVEGTGSSTGAADLLHSVGLQNVENSPGQLPVCSQGVKLPDLV